MPRNSCNKIATIKPSGLWDWLMFGEEEGEEGGGEGGGIGGWKGG